jgi:hypothetical protein
MSLRTRFFLTLVFTATLLAGPAFANGGKWQRHHDHHSDYHGHHNSKHRYHHAKHKRGYPVYRHGYAQEAYYCGPCSRHFDGYDDLSYHVHDRHHITRVQLPFVILHGTIGRGFGWVFHP